MAREKTHKKRIITPKVVKVSLMAAAVIGQFVLFVLGYIFFVEKVTYVSIVLRIFSIIVVLYIVRADSNPNYKIPWVVLSLLFPLFGGVLYFIYGVRHISKRELAKIDDSWESLDAANYSRKIYNDELYGRTGCIEPVAQYLLNKAHAPAYANTEAEYFPLGDDAFPVMIEELKKAKKFIFMEYFIIASGDMLWQVVDVLKQKAAEGVEVRFSYDSFASILKVPGDFVKQLRDSGISCYEFNTFRTILDSRYNNRNHRKICVIDGNVGFTGGINLADEYINRKKMFGHWKDTVIMIKGEAVWSLTTMYLALWDSSYNKKDDMLKYIPTNQFQYDDGYYIPYTDYPGDSEHVGKSVYYNLINKARKSIYIMTPYLIVDDEMLAALSNAAKTGVDVRIITPGIPDKKMAFMLTRSFYERLIRDGVKIYEYTPGFVHAKVFCVDDEIGVVGTINLDYRSLAHHFENAILLYKSKAIEAIMADYFDTISKSREINYEESKNKSLIKRIIMPILRLLAPMF